MSRVTSLATMVLVLALNACDDSAERGLPLNRFCESHTRALCAAAARCECGAVIAELPTQCPALAAMACPLAEGAPTRTAVEAGDVSYDDVAASRLVEALRTADCTNASPCGTAGPCIGLAEAGQACGDIVGCVAGARCLEGTCHALGADGSECTASVACTSGRCAAGVCTAKAGEGAACEADDECASGRCEFSTGRCRAPEPEGALCIEHTDCASGYCDRDLELGAGACRPLGSDGAPCDEDSGCAGGACIGAVCAAAVCDQVG